MSLTLFRKNLLRIDKSHGRRNLDYADMIHDKSRDEFFKRTIEMVQYNAAIIMVKWLLVLNYIKSSCNDEWTTKSCKLHLKLHLQFKRKRKPFPQELNTFYALC